MRGRWLNKERRWVGMGRSFNDGKSPIIFSRLLSCNSRYSTAKRTIAFNSSFMVLAKALSLRLVE